MSEKKRVVLIGTGGRANAYTLHGTREQVEIVGAADPSENNRRTFLGLNSLVGLVPQFDDWRQMLDAIPDVDGAIITTPNHLHTEPAVECMRRGIVLALEKPIAESPENCDRLLAAKREYNAQILIGFVMRSAPFYLRAKQWIDEERIGDVVSINATEIPHVLTTSVMFRSDWRRFQKSSGGSLLEKCCHDIDMFTWLAGSAPRSVSSLAGVKTLAPRSDRPLRCNDCSHQAECAYYLPPQRYDHPDQIKKANDGLLYKFVRDNSACIYNNGHDVYDHQSVQIEYENGAIAHLLMDFSGVGATCGRTLQVLGTRGSIRGKLEENCIYLHDYASDRVEKVDLFDDGSGHGGADKSHARTFLKMMRERDYEPLATLEAGYLSAMLCFAADQSAREKRHVDVSAIASEARLSTPLEEQVQHGASRFEKKFHCA